MNDITTPGEGGALIRPDREELEALQAQLAELLQRVNQLLAGDSDEVGFLGALNRIDAKISSDAKRCAYLEAN